jgi:hypothetical protein
VLPLFCIINGKRNSSIEVPGDYELSVRRAGCKVFRATRLHVSAAQLMTLDVSLEIGELRQ